MDVLVRFDASPRTCRDSTAATASYDVAPSIGVMDRAAPGSRPPVPADTWAVGSRARALRDTVAARVRVGALPADVAREYGVGEAFVREACRQHGVTVPSRAGAVAARRASLAGSVAAGLTIDAVALEHGVSEALVESACRQHGVAVSRLPRVKHPPIKAMQVVAALQNERISPVALARRLGVSHQAVRSIRHAAIAAGIRFPDPIPDGQEPTP